METLLHPFLTLRFAGLPAIAAQWDGGATVNRLDAHLHAGEVIQRQCLELCQQLEALCPDVADQSIRRALLDVKRALHNARMPKQRAWSTLEPTLAPLLRTAISTCLSELDGWQNAEADIIASYSAEIAGERARLRTLYAAETFRTAIELSNPQLASRLEKLLGPEGASLSEKDSNALWLSLAAYALRAACKTSPQSSFGMVAVGAWSEDTDGRFPAFSGAYDSDFQLRKAPIEQLIKPLLRQVAALDPSVILRPNPSLRLVDQEWQWVRVDNSERGNDRTFGAVTSQVRITPNPPLKVVLAQFRGAPAGQLSLRDLRTGLENTLPAALHEKISDLIQRLLDLHLLESLPQPQQFGAIEAARADAALLGAAVRQPVETAIDTLEQAAHKLASSERGQARQPLREVEQAFVALGAAAGRTVRVEDFRPIVHDDCSLPSFDLETGVMADILPDLAALLESTCLLGGAAGHATTGFVAAAQFLERYGADGVCTDVEEFLSAVAERAGGSSPQVSGSAPDDWSPSRRALSQTAQHLFRLADRFAEHLASLVADGEDRELGSDAFAHLLAEVPMSVRRRKVSHCINGQLIADPAGHTRFVINQIYPGGSRMISRFLPDNPEVRERVSGYLKQAAASKQPVAIGGTFGFNANLHPSLIEDEFDFGPYATDRAETGKIPLPDLSLRYDAATEQVTVHDAAGRQLEPVYLGILMAQRLPPPHRMLECLPGNSEGVTPFWLAIARKMEGFQTRIVTVPRLTLGSLVIARRTLYVPRSCFPDCGADNLEFFRAIQAWRKAHDVPRHIFYHRRLRNPALTFAKSGPALDDAQRQRMRMIFKPIYADLSSPTCIQLMKSNLIREEEDLIITESLPNHCDATCEVSGQNTVSELSVELTRLGL